MADTKENGCCVFLFVCLFVCFSFFFLFFWGGASVPMLIQCLKVDSQLILPDNSSSHLKLKSSPTQTPDPCVSSECFVSAFTDGQELGLPWQQNAFLPVHNRSQRLSPWERDVGARNALSCDPTQMFRIVQTY